MSQRLGIDDLTRGYRADLGVRDELYDEAGGLRPHWQDFLADFAALGPNARADMAKVQAERLLETGIAFNVQADPTDRRFSWRLDPLPVIITEDEWQELERGLVQRAELIDAILRDVYGKREWLGQHGLKPSLILGSADYVHAAYGWPKQPSRHLLIYACDLARRADGGWHVLADQVDAPSGHGWLLASRVSQANAMGDLYLESHVRRVAGYFAAMKGMFTEMVGDNGRIVVLSPGPDNPGYFSHAYLARYLGLPVVEAADLSHREGKLHVKTLEGLLRVDLLIRKVRSTVVDSLNIPCFGSLGTPGLTQAARGNKLVVANAIGSGVMQHRALANCGPELCRAIFGEELILPDSPALWLGDRHAIERFLEEPGWRIGALAASYDPGISDRFDPLEHVESRDERLRFIAREGYRWVAEQPTPLPTTPKFVDDRLEPVHWAVRVFVTLDENGQYRVLPGGLVRQAPGGHAMGLPNGYGSKDMWVLASRAEAPPPSLLQQRLRTVHLQRTGRDLLSRTAENLFWLGRYVERTETVLRVMSSIFARIIEDSGIEARAELYKQLLDVHLHKRDEKSDLASELARLMDDPEETYSLANSLTGIARNVALTQSVLSRDGWRVLQALHTDPRWKHKSNGLHHAPPTALINENIQRLLAFSGTVVENMTRNYAWRFLEMGRRLERAVQMSLLTRRLIDEESVADPASALTAMLEIGDSTMTYRSRYVTVPLPAPTADLLVLDETNPRSLAFQLSRLDELMAALPTDGPYRKPEHRRVIAALTELRMYNADALVEAPEQDENGKQHGEPAPWPLHVILDSVHQAMLEAADLISQNHFVIADTPITSYSLKRSVEQ